MKQVLFLVIGWILSVSVFGQSEGFRSPVEIKFSPDGKTIAVSDFTKGSVYFIDAESKNIKKDLEGFDQPFGLAWLENNKLAVSEYGAHQISFINGVKLQKENSIATVKYPMGITTGASSRMFVTGFGKSELAIVDYSNKKQLSAVPVWYQPDFVAASSENKFALVSNLTPRSSQNGAKISYIDLDNENEVVNIELPFGSTNVRQIKISPDNKWGYVVHTLGKVMLPTTQIERGWINTNVLSIIDLQQKSVYTTVPFDFVIRGGADPWGLELSGDGNRLYTTLAGVNELAVVKLDLLHDYLSGESKPQNLRTSDANAEIAANVWEKIYKDPSLRSLLADQFAALYSAGILERFPLPVQNPRGLALSPDGNNLVITGYYSGDLVWFGLKENKVINQLKLGNEPEMTLARQGEMYFHDATNTLQEWLSCVSCHPAGRADGLNWDLLNDGIGNPKNAKSLLYTDETPPSMSTGVREDYEMAVEKGFHFIKFNMVQDDKKEAIKEYLKAMKADPSPWLMADGSLSAAAKRGKEIFESSDARCFRCHEGTYLTDMKLHNVATRGEYDRVDRFDTPTLLEVWRTAPYLHDGSASTLEELFSPEMIKKHELGYTSHLSDSDRKALIEYIKSL